jgi:hypothetical protein
LEDNIKMDIIEINYNDARWMDVSQFSFSAAGVFTGDVIVKVCVIRKSFYMSNWCHLRGKLTFETFLLCFFIIFPPSL